MNGQPVSPALLKCQPFPDLLDYLRDQHGGGNFRLLIRRGDKMLLSGIIAIEPPSGEARRADETAGRFVFGE